MKTKTKITVDLIDALRERLEESLSTSLNESHLFGDIADIHEACRVYLGAIDKILSKDSSLEDVENILYEIDCELFEHLPYHLKSLRKLLPKMIHAIQNSQKHAQTKKCQKGPHLAKSAKKGHIL